MIVHDIEQGLLFPVSERCDPSRDPVSGTYIDNARLPVHRWIRFSAGFSAAWAQSVIATAARSGPTTVFDPFAGSGTTLLAGEGVGVESLGVEAQPFIWRIGSAKLQYRSDPDDFLSTVRAIRVSAARRPPDLDRYPPLIRKCYDDDALKQLDALRQEIEHRSDDSPIGQLTWLALVAILRRTSCVNTAQWQYVLPRKPKKNPEEPFPAFDAMAERMARDMRRLRNAVPAPARLLRGDARACEGVPNGYATLVVSSPPYPNNYDYADATRLEMCFFGEIHGWGELQDAARRYLIRSCTQQVPEKAENLGCVLSSPLLNAVRAELDPVCRELAETRLSKGGRKTYHLMVACYFLDLAQTWRALRRVCKSPSKVCFVIGDSAPYGVHVPVPDWLGRLAVAAGFSGFRFEPIRDRNVKWKNRKHRVPLCEGRLWVDG